MHVAWWQWQYRADNTASRLVWYNAVSGAARKTRHRSSETMVDTRLMALGGGGGGGGLGHWEPWGLTFKVRSSK